MDLLGKKAANENKALKQRLSQLESKSEYFRLKTLELENKLQTLGYTEHSQVMEVVGWNIPLELQPVIRSSSNQKGLHPKFQNCLSTLQAAEAGSKIPPPSASRPFVVLSVDQSSSSLAKLYPVYGTSGNSFCCFPHFSCSRITFKDHIPFVQVRYMGQMQRYNLTIKKF